MDYNRKRERIMKLLKTIFKSIAVAFSIYSKIPMPRFEWGSKDMEYHLCFFPWVGAFIGGVMYGWYRLCDYLTVRDLTFCLIAIAIPLFVTGGFHVDGFMDTMDALSSYKDKEEKLRILKDPHIGAFSVISMCTLMLILTGFFYEVDRADAIILICFGFFISRILSGLMVVHVKCANEGGMLAVFSNSAAKKTVTVVLCMELMVSIVALCIYSLYATCTAVIVSAIWIILFLKLIKKKFGGITGDLAGFFVVINETLMVIAAGVWCVLG